MRLVGSSVVLLSLFGSAHADGDALVDMMGPRELALGDAMRGGATGASAIALNPAGLPLNRELVFEGGYGYRGSDQTSMIGVSACDSTSAAPGCFFYDYAAANPDLDGMSLHRHTHVGGVALAYPITPRVFLGTSIKYFHFASTMMNEPNASGFNWDLGATARLTEIVSVGVTGYNLWGDPSVQFPRAAGGGLMARPSTMFAMSFDARWKLDGDKRGARYGGGAELFLRTASGQTGIPVRLGALHDNGLGTTYLAAGAGLTTMKLGVDIGARRAISGSNELTLIASMRFFGPRMAAPSLDQTP